MSVENPIVSNIDQSSLVLKGTEVPPQASTVPDMHVFHRLRMGGLTLQFPDDDEVDAGTMVKLDPGTLVPDRGGGGDAPAGSDLESDLGTLVINSDGEEDDSTMKRELSVPCCCSPMFFGYNSFSYLHDVCNALQ